MKAILLPALLAGLVLPMAAAAQTASTPAPAPAPAPAPTASAGEDLRFVLPKTVSPAAAAILTPGLAIQKALRPQRMAMALDFAALRDQAEKDVDTKVAATAKTYNVTYAPDTIGGVPVLRVMPPNAAKDGRVLVYVHGGGWIGGSAKSAFRSAAIFAAATGLRSDLGRLRPRS